MDWSWKTKIFYGMGLKLQIPTWNTAPGIQPGSDVVFPECSWNAAGNFEDLFYSIHVFAKFGINLSKDPVWERRDGFSFAAPVPCSGGVFGIGVRLKVVPTLQYRFSKPLPGLLFPGKSPAKNGKNGGKNSQLNRKFLLWNSALEGKHLGMVEEGGFWE